MKKYLTHKGRSSVKLLTPSTLLNQGKRHQFEGFTLIEMMIVVAIIGVLAAIAIPSYEEYIRKSARQEARASILMALQQQERLLSQTNSYRAYAAGDAAAASGLKYQSGDTGKPTHTIGSRICPGTPAIALSSCVEVFAVPLRSDLAAGTITMTSNGTKTCEGTQASTPGICW